MRNETIEQTLARIQPVNQELAPAIEAHLNNLTKPLKSLGCLEELARQYCLATNTTKPQLGKKRIYCFAADHGVADEGVSAFPKAVTPQMVLNMLAGGAAVNVLTRHAGAELVVVDMGVDDPLEGAQGLIRKKVAQGTASIARGPAMTIDQARQAVETGIELAAEAARDGVTLLGTGEMGIANTTPAAALFAAYLDCPPATVTGRGTGIDDVRLAHKCQIIEQALAINAAHMTDPLATLAALGGFEIAGICGLILGAAAQRIPVVVDGFISTAGALAAIRICPTAMDYLFFSHLSQEQGHRIVMEKLTIRPVLDLDMRLGEGTGAALAMPVIEASIKIYNEMATFDSAQVAKD